MNDDFDDGGPYNGIDWPETLRAAAKRLRLGVEGPRIADELDTIAESLAAPVGADAVERVSVEKLRRALDIVDMLFFNPPGPSRVTMHMTRARELQRTLNEILAAATQEGGA